MPEELKPCPFCGGNATIEFEDDSCLIRCDACSCRTEGVGLFEDSDEKYAASEQLKIWNRRSVQSETP